MLGRKEAELAALRQNAVGELEDQVRQPGVPRLLLIFWGPLYRHGPYQPIASHIRVEAVLLTTGIDLQKSNKFRPACAYNT